VLFEINGIHLVLSMLNLSVIPLVASIYQ